MRAAMSTIQQTLTAEAAALLSQAIESASRRRHGQTTPLHVAAALLSSPSGLLRQAAVRSHPHSSHPLQCRALELCFSVALDRLPSSSTVTEPPISNALFAALKRAQAHQRRGCSEQHQQPLLAVKVELDQLVLSILDDPSVSRVMREASFSSPSIKANIEQSLSISPSTIGGAYPYSNPHFHARRDEVKRVLEIMAGGKKRNPVLVGDSDPGPILRDVLRRIESGGDPLVPPALRGAQVISSERDSAELSRIPAGIRELAASIEARAGEVGVVLVLGDLKWLVEGPGTAQPVSASETARSAVVEMGKLLARFNNGGSHRVWLVGLATCATYLRCQVYYPSVEEDWDLQAAPIAPRSPLPCFFPRIGANGILGVPPRKIAPSLDGIDSSQKSSSLCYLCKEDYERELPKLAAKEFERSSSSSKKESPNPLPSWLQMPKEQHHPQPKEKDLKFKLRSADLLRRWQSSCSKLHPKPAALPLPPKLAIAGAIPTLQISSLASPTDNTVKTDLLLGQSTPSSTTMAKAHRDRVKDSAGCEQDKAAPSISDPHSFKRLFHGLTETVEWQPEAASAVATAVVQCKSGNGKLRPIWLLFDGSDKVGKLKMAAALSELMFGATPITIGLATEKNRFDFSTALRGKTSMDRVSDALRRNPFSVIVIEDIDSASSIDKGTLKFAMKTGRLPDSHGREIRLETAVFVLLADDPSVEEKVLESARSEWLLEFVVLESVGKRRAEWFCKDEGSKKKRERESSPGLSLDLNLAINTEDEKEIPAEGLRYSSDLNAEPTVAPLTRMAAELSMLVDEMVQFRPFDFTSVKRRVTEFIRSKFNAIVGHEHSIRIEEDALEKIVAGFWMAGAGVRCSGLEEWAEKMLVPGIHQIKACLKARYGPVTVQLMAKEVNRDVGRELPPAMVRAGSITVRGM